MRIIFAGTPEFSVPVLAMLLKEHPEHEVVAVYTQPDKPSGRGRNHQESPVKAFAVAQGIPVRQPGSLKKSEEEQEYFKSLKPDLMVVVAYGLLLPQIILDTPTFGCVNVHASLLPRWRGASPIQQAILAGDKKTGVSIMRMEAGLDTGPVYAEAEYSLQPTDTAGILHDKLTQLGAETLSAILPQILSDRLTPQKQDDTQACYAGKISKQDGLINWHDTATEIDCKVRAFNPWPVAYCYISSSQPQNEPEYVRVWQGEVLSTQEKTPTTPGTIIHVSPEGIDVLAGQQTIYRITELQLANSKKLSVKDYLLGHSLFVPGKQLET